MGEGHALTAGHRVRGVDSLYERAFTAARVRGRRRRRLRQRGRRHVVPYRPDGAYLEALRGGAAARDARLPLHEVLDEIGGLGGQLDEFEPAFTQPSQ